MSPRTRNIALASLFLISFGLLFATTVRAEPVTIQFTVEVLGTGPRSLEQVLGSVHVGDVLPVSLTYDLATPRGDPSSDHFTHYFDPAGTMRFGHLKSTGGMTIWVTDADSVNFLGDDYVFVAGFPPPPGFRSVSAELFLSDLYGPVDLRGTTTSGITLPRSVDDLARFRSTRQFLLRANAFGIVDDDDDAPATHYLIGRAIFGPEDPDPVPEPTTIALVGIGLAAIASKGRRRST